MNHSRLARGLTLSLLLTSIAAGCSDDAAEAGSSGGSGGQSAAGAGGSGGSTGGTSAGGKAGQGGSTGGASGGSGTSAGGKAGASAGGTAGASVGGSAGSAGTSTGGSSAGGAGGDAGQGGGGRTYSTDPATFFGEPRCAQAGVKLCEDFEAQAVGDAPDKATWQVQTWGKGTATIDDKHAARGKHSVHISAPAEVSRIVLRETKTFAATGNTFYGRFFLWLDYVPPPLDCGSGGCTNLVHWTAAAASGPYTPSGSDKTYTPENRAVGAVNQRLLVNLDGGPEPEVGISDHDAPAGQDAPVAGKWMCFEFAYEGVADQAEVRVWWDGLEHPGLHYSPSNTGETGKVWPIPTYANLDFGFTHYQDYSAHVPGFDAWIDEIAVDDQRIGCDL